MNDIDMSGWVSFTLGGGTDSEEDMDEPGVSVRVTDWEDDFETVPDKDVVDEADGCDFVSCSGSSMNAIVVSDRVLLTSGSGAGSKGDTDEPGVPVRVSGWEVDGETVSDKDAVDDSDEYNFVSSSGSSMNDSDVSGRV